MRYVIIRDDDTHAMTPAACLDRLYRPFLSRGMPVNLAVIPRVRPDVRTPDGGLEGFLRAARKGPFAESIADSGELASYLRDERGFHLLQHGCRHDYFEFGIRDAKELGRRLDEGACGFRAAGFPRPVTFVAPYDRLSAEAFEQAARRFQVISTGWFEFRRLPRPWWPSYLRKKLSGRAHWRVGRTTLLSHPGCLLSCHRPAEGMADAVRRVVMERSLTVLVTHWWEYFRDGRPDEAFIQALHAVAEWLGEATDVRVVTFSDVAQGRIPLS